MNAPFKSFCADARGNIAILAGLLLPLVIGIIGLGVDTTRYLKARSEIVNAADQAALAAVSVDRQDRIAVATRFFNLNISPEFKNIVSISSLDVVEGQAGAVSVDVQVNATIKTTFGGVIGVNALEITHTGQAMREVRSVEVVLTLASGGTMCSTKSRTPNTSNVVPGDVLLALSPDPKCAHFNAMIEGVEHFAEIMYNNEALTDVKLGFVPYNYKVRMPNTNNIPPSLRRNEPADFYRDVSDAEPLSPVLPLTSDASKFRTALGMLEQTPEGVAWSRTNVAAHVAGLMLDPAYTRYFRGGETPTDFNDPQYTDTSKVVILMSDGSNIGCCFTNWPEGDFSRQYVYFYEPDNKEQLELCEFLKENNVTIYSILFDVSEDDVGGRQINNLFARCASGSYSGTGAEDDDSDQLLCSDKQNCYNVSTDDELVKVYTDIAQSFYIPRLSQ